MVGMSRVDPFPLATIGETVLTHHPKDSLMIQFDKVPPFWLTVVTTGGQIHQFAPPSDRLDKESVVGKELSSLSALSKIFSRVFLGNPFSKVDPPTICSSLAIESLNAASWKGSPPNLPCLYCVFEWWRRPEEVS